VAPRPVARGPRVFLRPLSNADEDEFLERVRASRVLHRPWSHPPDTPEAFRDYVRLHRRPTSRGLLVCRTDDGGFAGWFGVSQIFHGPFRNAYLGYYAFVPHAGHGYMRDGLELVVGYAFGELGLHRLQASIQPTNERSIALVRGGGFTKEGFSRRYLKIGGRWRDHEHWAILADDPQVRRRT
jgi:[ribosomal protein S5]-alanine N-acetyltransferase